MRLHWNKNNFQQYSLGKQKNTLITFLMCKCITVLDIKQNNNWLRETEISYAYDNKTIHFKTKRIISRSWNVCYNVLWIIIVKKTEVKQACFQWYTVNLL